MTSLVEAEKRRRYTALMVNLFDTLDSDGDGDISWKEFVEFQLRSRQILETHWKMDIHSLRREFRELDEDGNGRISRTEFLKVMLSLRERGSPAGLAALEAIVGKVTAAIEESIAAAAAAAVAADQPETKATTAAADDQPANNGHGRDGGSQNGLPGSCDEEEAEEEWTKEQYLEVMMTKFEKADADSNGEITFSEFIRHEWTENAGSHLITLRKLRREFKKLDLDGNGHISKEEFKKIAVPLSVLIY